MRKFKIGDMVELDNFINDDIPVRIGIIFVKYQSHDEYFTTIQERYTYSDSTLMYIWPISDLRKL